MWSPFTSLRNWAGLLVAHAQRLPDTRKGRHLGHDRAPAQSRFIPASTDTLVKDIAKGEEVSLQLRMDGSITLSLTSTACTKEEAGAEGKNPRESLGVGSAMIDMWQKTQNFWKTVNEWPRFDEEYRRS